MTLLFKSLHSFIFWVMLSMLIPFAAPSARASELTAAHGKIQEIKPLSSGKYLLILEKDADKDSIVVTGDTVIRIAVTAGQIQEGDTIWASEGRPAATPSVDGSSNQPRGNAPVVGPPKPPEGTPPQGAPKPPSAPPQPPQNFDFPKAPPQPPSLPGQPNVLPQNEDTGQKAPSGQNEIQKKKVSPFKDVEPPADSLSPELTPLSRDKAEKAPKDSPLRSHSAAELPLSDDEPRKVVSLTKTEKGVLVGLKDSHGNLDKKALQAEDSLLKLATVEALHKGMFATIDLGIKEAGRPIAEKITATARKNSA